MSSKWRRQSRKTARYEARETAVRCTAGGGGEGDGGDEGRPFGVQPGQGVGAAVEALRDGLAGQGAQVVVGGVGGVPVVLQQPVEGRLGLVVAGRIAAEFGRVQADQIMHPPPVAADRLLGHEAGPGKRRQEGADLSGRGAGQRGGGFGGGIRARV